MTDIHKTISDLDRLHAEATPGEWRVNSDGDVVSHGRITRDVRLVGTSADDALVTALVNAYPTLRARIAELEEAAAGDAKVAAEAVQRIAELERKAAAVDGFLAAIQKPFTEDDLKQIEEARLVERKSKAFDAIAQAWVENRFSLTIGADNEDGFVDIDSLEPTDNPETLLTAIEAATAAKETPNG